MGPDRSLYNIGDRIYPVDEREISRSARQAHARMGCGIVLLVYGESILEPQAAYLGRKDMRAYFRASPDLLEGTRQLVEQYDPEKQYVLLELGRTEKGVLRIRDLADREDEEEEAPRRAAGQEILIQTCIEKGVIDGAAWNEEGEFQLRRGAIVYRLPARQVRRFLEALLKKKE